MVLLIRFVIIPASGPWIVVLPVIMVMIYPAAFVPVARMAAIHVMKMGIVMS